MPTQELSGTTALVTGASRGFGRAIAVALSKHGAHVAGVPRDPGRLEELRVQLGGTFTPVAADAADPVLAGQLLDKYRPRTLVLNAGAAPLTRPVHRQTWQTFSRNWEVDVQHVFNWTREALLLPLEPGSAVIIASPVEPRSTARHSAAATPEPRPPSGSSRPMPPRSPAGTRSASGSPRCCRSSLRKQTWARPQ
jgi:NAD(P)-dependent dehydrogenase (short-subunit alcohol dehydrogenase family)